MGVTMYIYSIVYVKLSTYLCFYIVQHGIVYNWAVYYNYLILLPIVNYCITLYICYTLYNVIHCYTLLYKRRECRECRECAYILFICIVNGFIQLFTNIYIVYSVQMVTITYWTILFTC